MRFETKIAVIVRGDLPTWQKLNMTAFLVSGIAATDHDSIGAPYADASGKLYLPMFAQPVLVFSATAEQIRVSYERAMARELRCSIFTEQLFSTGNDEDNRAAVRVVESADLQLAGMAMRAPRKAVDAVVKGLSLHP